MAAGFFVRMPRVGLVVGAIALGTAALGFAATSTLTPPAAVTTPVVVEPEPLVVPDVRKQAYVFAKGTLEQSGFAWRVVGAVPGYAANTVVAQTPEPGTRLAPEGAPVVVLRLARNGAYAQEGVPENASPYPGTPARPVGAPQPAAVETPPAAAPAAKPKPVAKPKPATKPKPAAQAKPVATRKPDFAVPGAPPEPADEMTLSVRAERLAAWLEQHPNKTPENVSHWLYQHNWIVTGARFGWQGGADALRTLVAVDRRVQELWGVGASSEDVAARALLEVQRRAG